MMRKFGLLGKSLSHSFSKKYFENKFRIEDIDDTSYEMFELDDLSTFCDLWEENLMGINVTNPYKEEVMDLLDELSPEASVIGAVNTIKYEEGRLIGYNTDVYGFEKSLKEFVGDAKIKKSLILGTGGAAKAVAYVFQKMEIEFDFVSRNAKYLQYKDLDEVLLSQVDIIVNATPIGMFPNIDEAPKLPYSLLGKEHFLFDLIYNPKKTLFLKLGMENQCQIKNGYDMLVYQAEKSWKIWSQ